MVHATRIKDGVASYCNHWVRTHKLAEEQRAKFPIYAKVCTSCMAAWNCWAGLFPCKLQLNESGMFPCTPQCGSQWAFWVLGVPSVEVTSVFSPRSCQLLSYGNIGCAELGCAAVQFGDQEGVRGVFVALLELLKQKVSSSSCMGGMVGEGAGGQGRCTLMLLLICPTRVLSAVCMCSLHQCIYMYRSAVLPALPSFDIASYLANMLCSVLLCSVMPGSSGGHHPWCTPASKRHRHCQHVHRVPCWTCAGPA
jgi:hypothetical protein